MSSRWLEMICACQIKPTHMTDIMIKQTASTTPFCDSEATVVNLGRDQAIVIDLPVLLFKLETATSIAVRSATMRIRNSSASARSRSRRCVSHRKQRDWVHQTGHPQIRSGGQKCENSQP